LASYTLHIPNRLDCFLVLPVLLYRWLRYRYTFRLVPLTRGLYAKVDPDMFYEVIKYKWHARKSAQTYYATSTQYQNGRRINLHMHRLIMQHVIASESKQAKNAVRTTQYAVRDKLPCNLFIDHINGDGRDNRRANLRFADSTQNNYNRRITSRRTSNYKGVDYRPSKKAYRARITVNKKKIFLGYFKSEIDAARAYDTAARKYHKEFAVFNFP
jgi:hypothetical protein